MPPPTPKEIISYDVDLYGVSLSRDHAVFQDNTIFFVCPRCGLPSADVYDFTILTKKAAPLPRGSVIVVHDRALFHAECLPLYIVERSRLV